MRELTANELQCVAGGLRLSDSAATGTGAGAAFGILATNTARGAAMGGAVGAALGFSFGVGYAIGDLIYNQVMR